MERNDETFMDNEMGWPMWPQLFIKKWENNKLQTGFLWGSLDRKSGEPHKAYLDCNLYMRESWENKEPVMMTPKELVDAGWVVD